LAKGSEASYKLLFRLLFNKDIEMSYPGRQMLRASDGKWEQETSIFCRVEYGDIQQLLEQSVDVITTSKTIKILVERITPVTILVDGVETYSENTYEILINRKYFGSLSVGDTISLGDTFIGKIVPTTSTVKVQQKGIGFKVGQLIPIQTENGYGSVVKISSVDSVGGIKTIQFIKYGIGYDTDIIQTIVADSKEESTLPPYEVSGSQITFNDNLNGFTERGFVNRNNYAVSAWDGSYAGEVLAQFSSSNSGVLENPEDAAIIKITLGGVAKYPGFYKNNDGFLDDDIYIQDSKYYQAFSYVIKIDERIEDFKSAVKTLLHPSGMAMFAEYGIVNNFDISVTLESMIKVLALTLRDEYIISDSISSITFSKSIEPDFIYATDYTQVGFNKILVDALDYFSDSSIISFNKALEDTITQDEDLLFSIDKALEDSIPTTDSTTYIVNKALEDTQSVSDSNSIYVNKALEDTQSVSDSNSIYVNKAVDNSTFLNDGVTVDDNNTFLSDTINSTDVEKYVNDTELNLNAPEFTSNTDQGSGTYGNYVMKLFGRSYTSSFVDNRLFGMIVRGAASSESEIFFTENYIKSKITKETSAFDPSYLFASGEQGAWYDPSDLSTIFADKAGEIPITSISSNSRVARINDKSGRGNHMIIDSTNTSLFPGISCRVNTLNSTNTLPSQSISVKSTLYVLSFSGSGSISMTGANSGFYTAGTYIITCIAGNLTVNVVGSVLNADLREKVFSNSNIPEYQSVASSGVTYDTVGFPVYIIVRYSTASVFRTTSSVDFTGTDKITITAGVNKLTDSASGILLELSEQSDINDGTFMLGASWSSTDYYGFRSKGTISSVVKTNDESLLAPNIAVVSAIGDIANDIAKIKIQPIIPLNISGSDDNNIYTTEYIRNTIDKVIDENSILNDEVTLENSTATITDSPIIQTTKYIEDTAYLGTESGSIRINAYAQSDDWDSEVYSNVRYPLFN
jgi:hypothetical protein